VPTKALATSELTLDDLMFQEAIAAKWPTSYATTSGMTSPVAVDRSQSLSASDSIGASAQRTRSGAGLLSRLDKLRSRWTSHAVFDG
jgi:hypothetical protein